MGKAIIYSNLAFNLGCIAQAYDLIHHYHKLPVRIQRTRCGRHQLAAGAFRFTLVDSEGREVFGSCDRAKDVWKAYKEQRLSYLAEYGSHTFIVE
jgi:hypothetical protein